MKWKSGIVIWNLELYVTVLMVYYFFSFRKHTSVLLWMMAKLTVSFLSYVSSYCNYVDVSSFNVIVIVYGIIWMLIHHNITFTQSTHSNWWFQRALCMCLDVIWCYMFFYYCNCFQSTVVIFVIGCSSNNNCANNPLWHSHECIPLPPPLCYTIVLSLCAIHCILHAIIYLCCILCFVIFLASVCSTSQHNSPNSSLTTCSFHSDNEDLYTSGKIQTYMFGLGFPIILCIWEI